jgi:hypothetical protein
MVKYLIGTELSLISYRINTEYGYRGKMAIFTQRVIIELKILYRSREQTILDGMAQTWKYADTCGADEAHLIIFDRDRRKPWEDKIFLETRVFEGTKDHPVRFPIMIWGM